MAVFEDITERKQKRGNIETMDELKRSNKELQRFAYSLPMTFKNHTYGNTFSQLLEKRYKDRLGKDAMYL